MKIPFREGNPRFREAIFGTGSAQGPRARIASITLRVQARYTRRAKRQVVSVKVVTGPNCSPEWCFGSEKHF